MDRTPTELFDCDRVGAYLESYLLDQVPPPERRGMRLHIHRCPDCFQKVISRDPLQLFAPLADQEPPAPTWDGFWPAIEAEIARRPAQDRVPGFVRWLAPSAWTPLRAAAVVTAAALLFAVPLVMRALLTGRPDAVQPPVVAAQPPVAGAPGATEPMPQTVEQVRTPDSRTVQVFSMSYGQGASTAGAGGEPPVTELVLIVDAGIDL